jgi:hypothetical protein
LTWPSDTTALYANLELNEEGEIIAPISFDTEENIDRVTGVKIMYDSERECTEDNDEKKYNTYTFELSIFCNEYIF